MEASFRIVLEHIGPGVECQIFRVSFEASDDRYLLNYPEVWGLRFTSVESGEVHQFGASAFVTRPLDEFVLNPPDRIAFDLRARINPRPTLQTQWLIELPSGDYEVVYSYAIDAGRRRYDYLNKGSRFAELTKPWSGEVVSNPVHFRLA